MMKNNKTDFRKKTHRRKRFDGIEAIKAFLIFVVLASVGYFGFSFISGGTKTASRPMAPIGKIYPLAEKALNEAGSAIVKIKEVKFTSTNPTPQALAGGLITYKAEISGYDEGKNLITETATSAITVDESADYKILRPNTIAIYDSKDSAGKTVLVRVKLGEVNTYYSYTLYKQSTSNTNLALLVNPYTGVTSAYTPKNITNSDELTYTNGRTNIVSYMAKEANTQLVKMVKAAGKAGHKIYACSGYRPYDTQQYLYNRAVSRLGKDQNDTAAPGHSEHQTGLTMDLIFPDTIYALNKKQEKSPTYAWMLENAHLYGFILRYPKSAPDITGYRFEPWHWRYIGVELATEYHESGMETLDEFLSIPRTATIK